MKVDNPLSREFLLHYPVDAARVLEQVSPEHVAALLIELDSPVRNPVITAMLPGKVAAIITSLPTTSAIKLFAGLTIPYMARIYRLLASRKQEELYQHLPDKKRKELQRYLHYPADSAGVLMVTQLHVLPYSVTVSEAIHRIEEFEFPLSNELYIVNEKHQLVGLITPGSLLTSSHHARLQDIMNIKTFSVAVRAPAESLLLHPGWEYYQCLPVVERDNTLVGVLALKRLKEIIGEREPAAHRDPLDNLLSVAGIYWLSMAQLLDGVLSLAERGKGERR